MSTQNPQEAEPEASLSTLFSRAKSSTEDLDTLDPRSDDFKTLLTSTIKSLQKCVDLVDRLSIFSPNEDLEDLSTFNIQYLTIPYLLSELLLRSYSPTSRLDQINQASSHIDNYLTRLRDYTLLTSTSQKLLETYRESRHSFRITPETAGLEAKRNTKIRRFQEEKSLKSRLALLRDQSQTAIVNIDEEVVRSLYLAELDLHTHQAFASLDNITQERDMLARMPTNPTPVPTTNGNNNTTNNSNDARQTTRRPMDPTYSDRLDPSHLLNPGSSRGILDSAGRPLQPFTITNQRSDLRQGVFRPSHNLPTMSIDEYLEEERRRGGIIEGGSEASGVVVQPDEDDVRAQDAATEKAREWDEFVEANPKGAGNTINRG